MAITHAQAIEAYRSLRDVFIPNGDAGVITTIRSDRAFVRVDSTSTRQASAAWYPLADLDTAETIRG